MKIQTSRKGQKCGKLWEKESVREQTWMQLQTRRLSCTDYGILEPLLYTLHLLTMTPQILRSSLFSELLDIYYLCRPPKKRSEITQESDEGGDSSCDGNVIYNRSCQNILPPSTNQNTSWGYAPRTVYISLNYGTHCLRKVPGLAEELKFNELVLCSEFCYWSFDFWFFALKSFNYYFLKSIWDSEQWEMSKMMNNSPLTHSLIDCFNLFDSCKHVEALIKENNLSLCTHIYPISECKKKKDISFLLSNSLAFN